MIKAGMLSPTRPFLQACGRASSLLIVPAIWAPPNNEMEMTAFLESLKKLEQLGLTQQPLLFVLNSQYVIKSVSDTKDGPAWMKSWKKRDWKTANGKPVANQELWQDIDRELAKLDSSKLKFAWLRSTVSDAGSDFVDSLLIKRMDE